MARPKIDDHRHLARMARRQVLNADASIGSLAQFEVSQGDVGGNDRSSPESRMKRLQRAFAGLAERERRAVGVYQLLDEERHTALRAIRGGPVVGPFSGRDRANPTFQETEMCARTRVAKLIGLPVDETTALAEHGLVILKNWLPNNYRDERI